MEGFGSGGQMSEMMSVYGATKRALNHWLRQALPNFEASLAYEMLNFLGPDAAEGLSALIEKRPPDFLKDAQ